MYSGFVSAKVKCPVRAKLKCPNYPSEDEVREAEIGLVTMSGRALISLTFHVAFEPSVALSRQHRALRVSLFETSQDGDGACCMPLAGSHQSIGRPPLRAWLEQCLRAERQARQCHLSLSILFS